MPCTDIATAVPDTSAAAPAATPDNASTTRAPSPAAGVSTRRHRGKATAGTSKGTSYNACECNPKVLTVVATPTSAAEKEPTNQELRDDIAKLAGGLHHLTKVVCSLCSGLGFDEEATEEMLTPTPIPSSAASPLAASPLDSPTIALSGLTLGEPSVTSRRSRTSSANSSVRSGKSGACCLLYLCCMLILICSNARTSARDRWRLWTGWPVFVTLGV